MLGSAILDVAIGMMLVVMWLSLIASAVREGLEGWLRMRPKLLESAIVSMIGERLVEAVYEHPLISVLYPGSYIEAKKAGTLPSYIPSRSFALVVFDLVVRGSDFSVVAKVAAEGPRQYIGPIREEVVKRVVHSAVDLSGAALAHAELAIARWFDSAMERVSGRYRRTTARMLFVIGLVVAVCTNVDAVRLARGLYRDPVARQAAIASAARVVADTTAAAREVSQLGQLPIGWPDAEWSGHWVEHVVGWFVTAILISFGAPFWFDVLNRVVTFRSTLKPNDAHATLPAASASFVLTSEDTVAEHGGPLHTEWAAGQPQRGRL